MTRRKLGNEKYYENKQRKQRRNERKHKVQQQLLLQHQQMTGLRGLLHHQDHSDKRHYPAL
eukprot:6459399-Amphidinium_carterae.1